MRHIISIFCLLAYVYTALGQSISIAVPTEGQNMAAGSIAEVVLAKPDSLTESTEIGVAILVQHCVESPCTTTASMLGQIAYSGPFNPQLPTGGSPGLASGAPYQSLDVFMPFYVPSGPAVINVVHTSLVGAGPFLFNETVNVTINIV